MPSPFTATDIANRALQLLGSKSIGSLSDNSRGAVVMNRAYRPVLLSVLRENYWSFSIQRATLAAAAQKPLWGKANYFPLPGDFLMLAPPDQNPNYVFGALPVPPVATDPQLQYRDWQIEKMGPGLGLAITTNDAAPLQLRYISNDVSEADFDSVFAEAFAARLALETCEEMTNSTSKMEEIATLYEEIMGKAKQRNAFEEQPVSPPVDPWITVRM